MLLRWLGCGVTGGVGGRLLVIVDGVEEEERYGVRLSSRRRKDIGDVVVAAEMSNGRNFRHGRLFDGDGGGKC